MLVGNIAAQEVRACPSGLAFGLAPPSGRWVGRDSRVHGAPLVAPIAKAGKSVWVEDRSSYGTVG